MTQYLAVPEGISLTSYLAVMNAHYNDTLIVKAMYCSWNSLSCSAKMMEHMCTQNPNLVLNSSCKLLQIVHQSVQNLKFVISENGQTLICNTHSSETRRTYLPDMQPSVYSLFYKLFAFEPDSGYYAKEKFICDITFDTRAESCHVFLQMGVRDFETNDNTELFRNVFRRITLANPDLKWSLYKCDILQTWNKQNKQKRCCKKIKKQ